MFHFSLLPPSYSAAYKMHSYPVSFLWNKHLGISLHAAGVCHAAGICRTRLVFMVALFCMRLHIGCKRCHFYRVPLKGLALHRVCHAEVYHLVESQYVVCHLHVPGERLSLQPHAVRMTGRA